MSAYTDFYLNSKSSDIKLDLLQISHPSFTKTFYIVRNSIAGITVTLEDGVTQQFFEYYPLSISATGSQNDLDQVLKVTLGDLGQLLPQQLDAVRAAKMYKVKPIMIYREYKAWRVGGTVNTLLLQSPQRFQIDNIARKEDGGTFQASAPRVNQVGTGRRYLLNVFSMLKSQ